MANSGENPLETLMEQSSAKKEPMPPHPDTPFWIARLLLLLLICVVLPLRGTALRWAETYPAAVVTTAPGGMAGVARFVWWLYHPPASLWLRGTAACLLVVLAAELLLALVQMGMQAGALRRTHAHYVRIRTPSPFSGSGGGIGSVSIERGEDLFRALHQRVTSDSLLSRSYVAMTLTGKPDEPVQLGAVIGGASEKRRRAWMQTLRSAIRGQVPDAFIDDAPDPLMTALENAKEPLIIAWRDVVTVKGPEVLIRRADEGERDFLGEMTAHIQSAAGQSVLTEMQVIMRPRAGTTERVARWRMITHRRWIRLRRRGTMSQTEDAKSVGEKLRNPAVFDTTIRLVAVGRDQETTAQAIDHMQAAFAIFQAQPGTEDRQKFIPAPFASGVISVQAFKRSTVQPFKRSSVQTFERSNVQTHNRSPPATIQGKRLNARTLERLNA